MTFLATFSDGSKWLVQAGSRSEAIQRVGEQVQFIRVATADDIASTTTWKG